MRPPQPPGHMVINLKTTVMTQGGHSGVIVHSGIQSSSSFSSLNGLGTSMWNSAPTRFPMIETPGGTRIASMASPLPLTIGPSTSQDNLNTSWSRPSPQYPTRATSYEQLNGFREPPAVVPRLPPRLEPREVRIEPHPLPPRRPTTPPSPVYDFTGRNTPPDEFIKPSKITLNVFDPGRKSPVPYEVGLRKSGNIATADALINDQVTTTTTVEVFRAPYDPSNPNKLVALPPAPAPGLEDRPQLLRLDGPGYEKWQSLRTETLINDRPVINKAVKWNEKLVERGSEAEYELARSRSPFANSVEPPRPSSANYQYYVPTVHHVDERLVPPMVTRATSPYMIQSPSEFSMTSHPMITSSQEELRRRADSALSYQQPLVTESPSQLAQLRVKESYLNGNTFLEQRSPVYVEPRGQESDYRGRQGKKEILVDNYGYSTIDRRHPRRSKSSHRNKSRVEELRARSVSPLSRRPSWAEDPNRLPNLPLKLTPADSTHLYQTRDAFDNLVTQFRELEFDISGGLLLSPLCDSTDSLISEVSARNDKARADCLEAKVDEPLDIYKIAEEFYNSRNPLMTSQSAENIYTVPRSRERKLEEKEEEEEHIYEELDSIRPSVSYSHLAHIYASVAPEYRDNSPPPLPPRRRKEDTSPLSSAFLSTDSNPLLWLPDTPETTPNKPRPSSLSSKSSSASSAKSSTSSSSGEEVEKERSLESEGSLGTTTADSSSDEFPPTFTEVMEEDWPPPPNIMRRKKVHPDGHVFPRITSSIVMMPQLPEDKEFTSSGAEEEAGGIKLSPLSLEIFNKEPKGASPANSTASSSSGDSNKEKAAQLLSLEEDLPFADASPRPG